MPRSKTDFTNFIDTRPNYFPGQYLLEDDFEVQHQYLSDHQLYHHKSLHVAGILEGLEVEAAQGQKAVSIKSGSAIDGNGNLIIFKKDTVFSSFGNVTTGELYIQYTQVQQVKQQSEIPDSFTRWQEVPVIQFAAKAPDNAVKLASIAIANDLVTVNLGVRVYSGVFLPNPAGNDLTLRSGGSANPNLAVLNGNLSVTGDFTVTGTITGKIDTANITSGILNSDRIPNLSADKITTGILNVARIPNLSADKITAGTFSLDRIPTLTADKIPPLTADKITAGVFSLDRIPTLTADKMPSSLTSGNISGNLTVAGNAEIRGTMTGAANAYQKAQFTMSGGGTVTWGGVGGRLKWTQRFIAISMENSVTLPAGHINISQPTANIPAAQIWDGKERAADANGVVLNAWEALYAVHTVGGNQDQVILRIVNYSIPFTAPSNWILIAVVNSDSNNNSIKLGTGVFINANGTYTAGGTATGSFSDLSIGGNLSFGATVRQMINLWTTEYGIGIQDSTQYFRTGANFAWYKGGTHNNAVFNAGGGTAQMLLDTNGTLTVSGAITPSVGNDATKGIMFPTNPGGGGGDAAWIRYYVNKGESCTLEIAIENDPDDILYFNANRINSKVPVTLSSSSELKENILELSVEEALETIQNLRPVKYEYKAVKNSRANLGFIAEEMPDNLASSDRKSISPMEIIPVLTTMIQEQQRAIKSLQENLYQLTHG